MGIIDLFSKRQRKLRGEVPDVYVYTSIPETLRTQIVHIWLDALGNPDNFHKGQVSEAYKAIVDTLCREYGVFSISKEKTYGNRNHMKELFDFVLNERSVERVIDAIELGFRVVDRLSRERNYLNRQNSSQLADEAIEELNCRFKEHGVGFYFADGEIIRVDSEFLHVEAVKPALRLLSNALFAGAQQEFLKAHEHYRAGNSKEALNECLKSFESIMKAICTRRRWQTSKTATAKELIKACIDNGLIPSYWDQHYSSLRSMLESGIPTGRNKLSGHGQGAAPIDVPSHLVSYMLHMTASSIVFLGEADAALK